MSLWRAASIPHVCGLRVFKYMESDAKNTYTSVEAVRISMHRESGAYGTRAHLFVHA